MGIEVNRYGMFGGQYLRISPDANLADMPTPFRELLRDEHREAFANPSGFFTHLADISALDAMRLWFTEMAKANRCELQVHLQAAWRVGHGDVVVRGFPRGRHSDFRLQSFEGRRFVSRLPSPLSSVYDVIDSTVEEAAGLAGGINSTAELYFDYVGSRIPIEDGTSPDLLKAPIFYRNDGGDHLVACGGRAYWYLHEVFAFREAGELTNVISGYFHSLLDGRKWVCEPYSML